jgi:hypothetical protein
MAQEEFYDKAKEKLVCSLFTKLADQPMEHQEEFNIKAMESTECTLCT